VLPKRSRKNRASVPLKRIAPASVARKPGWTRSRPIRKSRCCSRVSLGFTRAFWRSEFKALNIEHLTFDEEGFIVALD
jgi:hypothetical protein